MAAYDYQFVTHWQVEGPREQVFQILKDGENYAQWWRPAYVQTKKVGEKRVECLVRARLPYTLRFATELIRETPPEEILLKSTGELAGTGRWRLQQVGAWTEIEFDWQVRAEKPLVRWLSFLLKPLFRWNHDWVMRTGELALRERLTSMTKACVQ